jgi:hypothetical protein
VEEILPDAPAAGRRRTGGAAVSAIALAVLVVAGLLFFFTRSKGEALALEFHPGANFRYSLHTTMSGGLESSDPRVPSSPLDMNLVTTFSWHVVSVDAEGVAAIDYTVESVAGTVNGGPVPSAQQSPSTQIKIASDGRVLTAGELSFSTAGSRGTGFPGMDQLAPLLPSKPVKPGDTWTREVSQPFPLGSGTIQFTSRNEFLRYATVYGEQAAVIRSNIEMPMDFELEFDKLFALNKSSLSSLFPAGVKILYKGHGSFVVTSSVGIGSKQLLQSESTGSFDLQEQFVGLSQVIGDTPLKGTVKFSEELKRAS